MIRTLCAITVLACLPHHTHAAGDAEAGKAKSTSCSICHGADGRSQIPMYPKLAGQHQMYLANALKAYKSGDRRSALASMMVPNVAMLSEQDIEDLAAYYASLAP
jgi:cytochrome c553